VANAEPDRPLVDRLRTMIVTGAIVPGTYLSQVKLSAALGVSTTPLREALRQLEAEGLVESRRNRRPRVPPFNLRDLEGVHSARILLECLGIALAVPRMTNDMLEQVHSHADNMTLAARPREIERWHHEHSLFHGGLVQVSNPALRQEIATLEMRSERYRRTSVLGDQPLAWSIGEIEHESIYEACPSRRPMQAAARLAQHLSRSALTVAAHLTPAIDPVGIRVALQMVLGWEASGQEPEQLMSFVTDIKENGK
jgi:DNA-binding GntR family transcriptional regulator